MVPVKTKSLSCWGGFFNVTATFIISAFLAGKCATLNNSKLFNNQFLRSDLIIAHHPQHIHACQLWRRHLHHV